MGGWKSSGLGSRHGADGIRKYTAKQSILVTPAHARSRASCTTSRSTPRSRCAIAEAVKLHGDERAAVGRPARDAGDALRHLRAVAGAARSRDQRRAGDPTRLLGARRVATSASPRRSSRCWRELPAEQVEGMRAGCSTRSPTTGFNEAPQEAREQMIHAFADSSPETLGGVSALRGADDELHYALPDLGTGRNPNWAAIGYPGPLAPPRAGRKADRRPAGPRASEMTIEADVCIVGSGAGGGVIAGELGGGRQAGLRASRWAATTTRPTSTASSCAAYERMYLNGGPFPTAEGPGLDPRRLVRSAAARRSTGPTRFAPIPGCASSGRATTASRESTAEFDRHFDAVMERTSVNEDCSRAERAAHAARATRARRSASTSARRAATPTPRPTTRRSPATWATATSRAPSRGRAKTYLADAHDRGADLVVQCRVERILVEDGRAAGVEGTYTAPDGSTARVVVRAPQVVVAVRLDRVAGPADALGNRRPGGRQASAASSDERRSAATTPSPRTPGGARRRRRSRTSSPTSRTATDS